MKICDGINAADAFVHSCSRAGAGSADKTPLRGGLRSPGGPLLSMSEVETMFHEFGHVLHSVFSRTRYQSLSGTRTQTDFVEVPSHLFEGGS